MFPFCDKRDIWTRVHSRNYLFPWQMMNAKYTGYFSRSTIERAYTDVEKLRDQKKKKKKKNCLGNFNYFVRYNLKIIHGPFCGMVAMELLLKPRVCTMVPANTYSVHITRFNRRRSDINVIIINNINIYNSQRQNKVHDR
ncbi:hypothetical protein PUN28_008395 [Cardiocondyla obscurior]|uniref:Uncharacterized protein n=1 Tax=Cardiocondyla obscurior TaxID=286306 RepID=A0AAW2FZK7_9HYME